MKLIESKAEFIPQINLYKHMELCGRIAYKSEDKITKDSARIFVNNMINAKHGAVLEHGTVYLIIPEENQKSTDYETLITNPYTKSVLYNRDCYITTNYRVLLENKLLHMMIYEFIPTEHHIKRYTIKFICSRSISHELVRHRKFSFIQESQRYCNYTKGKFGDEITFIIPYWYNKFSGICDENGYRENGTTDFLTDEDFVEYLKDTESMYKAAIMAGATPQEARAVLPNATKTDILMTGFASDWRFFFDLRYYGETGKPHPDMVLLAGKAREEFIKAGIWEDIMSKPSKFDK